jgi:hypothetical protein
MEINRWTVNYLSKIRMPEMMSVRAVMMEYLVPRRCGRP